MTEREEQLIRDNERMKTALETIKRYAMNASVGWWRQQVVNMASIGLYPGPRT